MRSRDISHCKRLSTHISVFTCQTQKQASTILSQKWLLRSSISQLSVWRRLSLTATQILFKTKLKCRIIAEKFRESVMVECLNGASSYKYEDAVKSWKVEIWEFLHETQMGKIFQKKLNFSKSRKGRNYKKEIIQNTSHHFPKELNVLIFDRFHRIEEQPKTSWCGKLGFFYAEIKHQFWPNSMFWRRQSLNQQ